jgi:hypothetical protein
MNIKYLPKYLHKSYQSVLSIIFILYYTDTNAFSHSYFILDQGFPTSGPRATCGPPDHFCGPRSCLGFVLTYLN